MIKYNQIGSLTSLSRGSKVNTEISFRTSLTVSNSFRETSIHTYVAAVAILSAARKAEVLQR